MSRTRQKPASRASAAIRRDPLASLKMTDMVISKPFLPAEILVLVADYLSIPDLLRFARVSRRMHEMVYDDSRWIQRLSKMGCWNEGEARQRLDEARKSAPNIRRPNTTGTGINTDRNTVNGKGRPDILFDATTHTTAPPEAASRAAPPSIQPTYNPKSPSLISNDGFDAVSLSSPNVPTTPAIDTRQALTALRRVRSIRGYARQEYAKLYAAIGPFYVDVIKVDRLKDALLFKTYDLPADQAQMLTQVRTLAYSDFSSGAEERERKIKDIVDMFDTSALLEFRQGYEYKDIQGRMRQYAHVIFALNGGKSAVDLFLYDNKMIVNKASLGSASDCIDYSQGWGQLSLERVQAYFERLAVAFAQEAAIVRAVFPNADDVLLQLLETTGKEILAPFLTALFTDAQGRSGSLYLKTISGTFAATRQFIVENCLTKDSNPQTVQRANAVIGRIYEPHLEPYLLQELESFRVKADSEIEQWDRVLSEQAASTESYLMSNINRGADKKDFLSSFKKVVMAPVNLLPSFSTSAPTKTAAKALVNGEPHSGAPSRSSTPNPLSMPRSATPSLPPEAPTNELAAKAALMNTKLDNIKSLFSIEVALNLVHAAKSSLERIAQFISLGDTIGASAKQKCRTIFSLLLHTVGTRHVKAGFDTAIDHLSSYRPREAASLDSPSNLSQVAPLTTFLELVNVGDLIQQMLDVFYESELIGMRICSRDDFLDPSVKEKKKFEAMLDERVASGLSKGIDVLMDEIEYLCATTQLPTDFNPQGNVIVDVGPTKTATQIIAITQGHTSMLNGATEKTLLDVFVGEVGLRLFQGLCKHIKRQRVSTAGALPLISDLSAYARYIGTFRNVDLNNYFTALREVAQIYLVEGESDRDVGEMAAVINDSDRYKGIFTVEEVVEFAERRSDWLVVRARVEKKVQGDSCTVM